MTARTTEPSLSTAEDIKQTVRGFILSSITITQLRDDDDLFDSTVGLELLAQTARLWHSLGHHPSSKFHSSGKP